jgi:hypothetical protein
MGADMGKALQRLLALRSGRGGPGRYRRLGSSGLRWAGSGVLMRAGSIGRVRMLCCVSSSLIPLIARHREVVCVVEFVAP